MKLGLPVRASFSYQAILPFPLGRGCTYHDRLLRVWTLRDCHRASNLTLPPVETGSDFLFEVTLEADHPAYRLDEINELVPIYESVPELNGFIERTKGGLIRGFGQINSDHSWILRTTLRQDSFPAKDYEYLQFSVGPRCSQYSGFTESFFDRDISYSRRNTFPWPEVAYAVEKYRESCKAD